MNKIHPSSEVLSKEIGQNVIIWQYVVIMEGSKIGNNVNINAHCLLETGSSIGNNSTLKSGVYLWNGVKVGDDVFVGPNVTFTNDKYPKNKNEQFELLGTIVEDGASIGAGSVILPNIVIGKKSLVGAGSVVTKNVPSHAVVYGNPARIIEYICDCGAKNQVNYCNSCNKAL